MRRQDWQGSLVCQQLVWLVPTGRLHDTSYNCKKKLTSIKRFRSFTGKSSMNLECIRGPRPGLWCHAADSTICAELELLGISLLSTSLVSNPCCFITTFKTTHDALDVIIMIQNLIQLCPKAYYPTIYHQTPTYASQRGNFWISCVFNPKWNLNWI